MEVDDDKLVEIAKVLKPLQGTDHARLMDEVVASLSPIQRYLFDHWHSYVCQNCGEVMVVPDAPRTFEE